MTNSPRELEKNNNILILLVVNVTKANFAGLYRNIYYNQSTSTLSKYYI